MSVLLVVEVFLAILFSIEASFSVSPRRVTRPSSSPRLGLQTRPKSGFSRGVRAPRAAIVVESADKPNSVVDGHPSGMRVTTHLVRPTRRHFCLAGHEDWRLTWPCSGRGFPCHECYHSRGALLPHHFTLTSPLAERVWRPFSRRGGSPDPPGIRGAVSFLWHFPSRCRAQPLAGALP